MPDRSWKLLSTRILSDLRVLRLRADRYRLEPEGLEDEFYVLETPDWVNVIPVTPEGDVVLVRQYRHGIRRVELEIPGGMIDPGEDAAEAAARELREETGCVAARMRSLGAVAPNPALQGNLCHTFVAEEVAFVGSPEQDAHERIEVVKRPLAEIPDLIATGEIQHSLVVVAFARLGILGK